MRKLNNTEVLILPLFALSEILFFKDKIGMMWTMIVWGILAAIQFSVIILNCYRKVISALHALVKLLLTLSICVIWISFSCKYIGASVWSVYAVVLLLFLMAMEACISLEFNKNAETTYRMLLTDCHTYILTSLMYFLLF